MVAFQLISGVTLIKRPATWSQWGTVFRLLVPPRPCPTSAGAGCGDPQMNEAELLSMARIPR